MNFRKAREEAGLELTEAAQLLETSRSTLWRIEAGKTRKVDHNLVDRMKKLYASKPSTRRQGSATA